MQALQNSASALKLQKIDDYLSKIRFNGCILIQYLNAESPAFEKQYGFASLNDNNIDNTVFTADTIFGLASISKQFTAVAILLLQERNLLNINSIIGNYLHPTSIPATWGWINNVTIAELLEHRSGLPDDLYDVYNCSETIDHVPVKTAREHYVAKENSTIRPDEEIRGTYSYSNIGYSLLAILAEDISGVSFATFLQQNLFTPCNMLHTFVGEHSYHAASVAEHPAHSFAHPLVAEITQYNPRIKADISKLTSSRGSNIKTYGDDRVFSNCKDLLLWSKCLYNGSIINLETLNGILENKQHDCAYGIDLEHIGNNTIYGHDGMTLGVATDLRFIKEHSIIIAILSNVTANSIEPIRAFENKVSNKFEHLDERDIITESFVYSLDDSLAIFAAKNIRELICYAGIKDNQFLFFKGSKYGDSNISALPENVMQKIINFSIPKLQNQRL